MSKEQVLVTAVVLTVFGFSLKEVRMVPELFAQTESQVMDLPAVERKKPGYFSDLMYQRSSVRSFSRGTISLEQVSKILFAAQGITRGGNYRTVPSAGALYPLEVYLS
ncbi:MAG: nitroreductase family protein [Desulfohalobiaceae bacterium]|nr:nitroreductase family protein [Desulfohalobiaceae bacterium]